MRWNGQDKSVSVQVLPLAVFEEPIVNPLWIVLSCSLWPSGVDEQHVPAACLASLQLGYRAAVQGSGSALEVTEGPRPPRQRGLRRAVEVVIVLKQL